MHASLQEQRRRLELGGNPFDAVALCLTSLDFAKQERVLEELERVSRGIWRSLTRRIIASVPG